MAAPVTICHPSVRHLLLTLATHLDRDTGLILPHWQPSISQLAREMGTDRRTASRRIRRAMAAGWLRRKPPTVHDARTKHARTHYTLQYPDGYTQARGTLPQQLGASDPLASGTMPPGLGADQPEARGTMPDGSPRQEGSSANGGDAAELSQIAAAIRARSGKDVPLQWAAEVRGLIIAGRAGIRDRAAYCSRVIAAGTPEEYVPNELRGY